MHNSCCIKRNHGRRCSKICYTQNTNLVQDFLLAFLSQTRPQCRGHRTEMHRWSAGEEEAQGANGCFPCNGLTSCVPWNWLKFCGSGQTDLSVLVFSRGCPLSFQWRNAQLPSYFWFKIIWKVRLINTDMPLQAADQPWKGPKLISNISCSCKLNIETIIPEKLVF